MRILIMGATGAMGKYLVPLLAEDGHQVTAAALDEFPLAHPNLRCVKGDLIADLALRRQVLAEAYDAIVDFLVYPSAFAPYRLVDAVRNTGQYIYLSSYRIYADEEHPIRETSRASSTPRRTRCCATPTTTASSRRAAKTSCAPSPARTGPSSGRPSPIH